MNSSGLCSAFPIISFIALISKPACFGRSALDRAASTLGSTSFIPSQEGNDKSLPWARGGSSSSRESDLEVAFDRDDVPDGGRDTVAGEEPTDDFFLR